MHINPIRTDERFPFAYQTMTERLPAIIRELQAKGDFPGFIKRALDELHQMMLDNSLLPEQDYLAPDAVIWIADFEAHRAETWLSTEWFFVEMLFFREIINRVQYWQTGKDPYQAIKSEELYSAGLREQLLLALAVTGSPQEILSAMFHFALWGNRMDMSLPEAMAHGQEVSDDDLLLDDRALVIEALLKRQGAVHIITDNFGTELAMDFALIYNLLKLNIPVVAHVKMNPTYVSDATAADIRWMLDTLPEIHSKFVPLVETLKVAFMNGQWRVYPDFFWNSSRYYSQMPDYLHMAFSQARVIISKGDANYRRALYDTIWSVDEPFATIVGFTSAPFVALRTLKSDPIVGISSAQAESLNRQDANWRTNGKRGIIQFRD